MESPNSAESSAGEQARRGPGTMVADTVIFVMLLGLAMGIVAGTVLVPAYARVLEARYERDVLAAKNADDQSLSLACDRLIEAIPNDSVLAKRIAMRQFGFLPRDEVVYAAGGELGESELLIPERHERPSLPDRRILVMARKLKRPATRLTLLLAAIGIGLAGFLLTGPRGRKAR